MSKKPSDKQKLFCREYIKDFNATQAYIRAGYSKNGAAASASALLGNPKVKKYINKLKEKRVERLDIDADWVLKKAVELHERCMDEAKSFEPQTAARSLELIGKHIDVGAFREQVDMSVNVSMEQAILAARERADGD